MNLQQQTQNVAAQGRYGDTMLMHVNPAEVAGLSQVLPLTINPETGQPEAFLPMLLPLLGSIGGSALAGSSLIGGALAGKAALLGAIGSGLGTWAATGDVKKGLLSGLTGYGLGKVFSAGKTAAEAAKAGTTVATKGAEVLTSSVNPADIGMQGMSGVMPETVNAATAGAAGGAGATAGSGLTAGLGAAGRELMKPATMIPLSLGLGGQGIMQSQEDFHRQMENLKNNNEEEYNRILAEHPEYIPMLQNNQTQQFARGGQSKSSKAKKEFKPVAAIQARDIDPYFMAGLQGERGYLKNVNPSSGQIISGKTGYDFGTEMADAPMSAPFNPTQTVGYQSFYNAPREPYVLDPYAKQTFEAPPAPVAPPIRPPSELEKVAESNPVATLPVPPPEESRVAPFNPASYINPDSLNEIASMFTPGMSREAKEELDTGVPMNGMMDVTAPPPREAPTPAPRQAPPPMYMADTSGLSREEIESGAFDPSMMASLAPMPTSSFDYMAPPPLTTVVPRGQDRAQRRGGRNRKAEGGPTDLPNEGLKALAKEAPEAVKSMGFQEGGPTMASNMGIMDDPLTRELIDYLLGRSGNSEVLDKFLAKYGNEAYMEVRDAVLKQSAMNQSAITEGLIAGEGGGMDDSINGVMGDQEKVAVSQDEFIIPADVVSQLGDGSSNAGADKLYEMMDRVRQNKTGTMQQASKLPQGMMPA